MAYSCITIAYHVRLRYNSVIDSGYLTWLQSAVGLLCILSHNISAWNVNIIHWNLLFNGISRHPMSICSGINSVPLNPVYCYYNNSFCFVFVQGERGQWRNPVWNMGNNG